MKTIDKRIKVGSITGQEIFPKEQRIVVKMTKTGFSSELLNPIFNHKEPYHTTWANWNRKSKPFLK